MGRTSEFLSLDARAVDSGPGDAEVGTRRGMSRRQLIRNAGIAGAAAWTAPIIIDSVSSAAMATVGSACAGGKYYMKIVGRGQGAGGSYTAGDCYTAAPACSNTTDFNTGGNSPNNSVCSTNSNYTWVCTGGSTHGAKFWSSFVNSNPGAGNDGVGTFTVTLATNCTFQSTTTYKSVGNYDFDSDQHCVPTPVTPADGSNVAVFPKSASWPAKPNPNGYPAGSGILDYMYMEFVCT